MKYFIRVVESIAKVGSVIGYISLTGMVLVVVTNIILRLFGSTVPGSYSLVVIIAVLVASPAILRTQVEKGHITVDLIAGRFSTAARVVLEWIGGVVSIATWGLIAWASLKYAWLMWVKVELLDPLKIPVAPFRFIWGLALVLFCLAVITTLFKKPLEPERGE